MANPTQLFLLADHIKLSLLERQRAISLNLEPNSQDGNISRSLESMREGIEAIEQQITRAEERGEANLSTLQDQLPQLRSQYTDLETQFRGFSTTSPTSISQPNDPALKPDFDAAQEPRSRNPSSSHNKSSAASKTVRFTDTPPDVEETAARAALFPYRDDPASDGAPDQSNLDNVQIHEYHKSVLRDQDEHLDRLGESIGRQRDLSIQIGDELDEHVMMLDDVEDHVDRHQGRLDGARRSLGKVARKANDNKQLTAIFILIIVLVLLIVILK